MTAGIAYVEGRWEFILFRARAFDDRSGIDVRGSLSLSLCLRSRFLAGALMMLMMMVFEPLPSPLSMKLGWK